MFVNNFKAISWNHACLCLYNFNSFGRVTLTPVMDIIGANIIEKFKSNRETENKFYN